MGSIVQVGRLIDGSGASPVDNAEVLIEDGKIQGIGRQGGFSATGHRVASYPTATMIPGLIDLHVHFCYDTDREFQTSSPAVNRVGMMEVGFRNARHWLEQGVTTARVLGTPFDMDVGLKELIVEQPELGPRLVTAGRMMTMSGGKRNDWDYMKDEITGETEARRWTRVHMKEGADVIKLYCTTLLEENVADYIDRALALPDDAPDPGRWGSLTEDEIRATVTEAHKVGRTVAAHASPSFGIKLALRGGVDTIEHGSELDDECIELLLSTGATLVPTLTVTHHQVTNGEELGIPPQFIEFARRRGQKNNVMVKRAFAAGVAIGTGTDAVVMQGMEFWTELELLVDLGLPPLEAIRCATGRAAACLGLAGAAVGTLEPGKWADMVVLSADPASDIKNIRRIEAVYKAGDIVAGSAGQEVRDV